MHKKDEELQQMSALLDLTQVFNNSEYCDECIFKINNTYSSKSSYMSVACVLIIITCFVVSQIVTLEYTYVLNFTTGRSYKNSRS